MQSLSLADGDDATVPVQDVLSGTAVTSLGTLNFLVVEDDPNQQQLLGTLFETANSKNADAVLFNVQWASTAEEALRLLQGEPKARFDLILLDVVLPDINGYDVLPSIRQLVGDDVAIIASAHSQVSQPLLPGQQLLDAATQSRSGSIPLSSLRVRSSRVVPHCPSQLALVQLCVRRGADAFLVKPLGSPAVQHLWQFVKNLKPGRAERSAELQALLSASSEGEGAINQAGATASVKPANCAESVVVCAGCLTAGADEPPPIEPVARRARDQLAHGMPPGAFEDLRPPCSRLAATSATAQIRG